MSSKSQRQSDAVRGVTFSFLCPLLEKYGTFIARCNALIEKVSSFRAQLLVCIPPLDLHRWPVRRLWRENRRIHSLDANEVFAKSSLLLRSQTHRRPTDSRSAMRRRDRCVRIRCLGRLVAICGRREPSGMELCTAVWIGQRGTVINLVDNSCRTVSETAVCPV
eukprot:SAG31_NODE_799_length_12017_cov_5.478436_1_plen_164_part_00